GRQRAGGARAARARAGGADALPRSPAGRAGASARARHRRLRVVPSRRPFRLPARRSGRRRGPRRDRCRARRRSPRLDAAPDLPAAAARPLDAALSACAGGGRRGRRKALEADRGDTDRGVARAARAGAHLPRSAVRRFARPGGAQLEPGAHFAPARAGISTVASDARTRASATSSVTLGRSSRKTMPPTTATAGMTRMLSENTVTDTDVASLIHAQ